VKKLAMLALVLLFAGCREKALEPMTASESADLQAKVYGFQVFPGATFLEDQTELLRRAHFVMQPDAVEAPPMAMYATSAPLEEVARFYAEKYGYERVAPDEVNDFSSVKPAAYYTAGDLASDAAAVEPILLQLDRKLSHEAITGGWRGAHISARDDLPRVTLQRPFVDMVNDRIVDQTLILMVRE
jgi:hypothetical protein